MLSSPNDLKILTKQELRKQFKDIRAEAFGKLDSLMEEANVQSILTDFLGKLGDDKIISFYYPIDFEINIIPVLKFFDKKKRVVCLPVVKDKGSPLEFRRYSADDKLHLNQTYKIKEPAECAEIVIPDIMVVPMIAFDKAGYRLGFGKGFFDRTIAELREFNSKLITIGVGYSFQCIDGELPRNEYDQKLDYILSGKEILKYD